MIICMNNVLVFCAVFLTGIYNMCIVIWKNIDHEDTIQYHIIPFFG